MGEITKAQHADHQRLMEQINHELQDKLGCGLAEVRYGLARGSFSFLTSHPGLPSHTHKHWPKP